MIFGVNKESGVNINKGVTAKNICKSDIKQFTMSFTRKTAIDVIRN